MHPIVLAMTGASGALYGVRLLNVLLAAGRDVHLVISPAAAQVFRDELQISLDLNSFDPTVLTRPGTPGADVPRQEVRRLGEVTYCHYLDWEAGIASGSFRTAGMVVCPCSMGTLASLAGGLSSNLIHRAADVHLKERRRLVVVPRETPLGRIQLQNMTRLAESGAVLLPAMPGFYHRPQSILDLVDFVVGRICDQLDVEIDLVPRWGASEGTEQRRSPLKNRKLPEI